MALFIWGYWRHDVIAMIALGICVILGAVPFKAVYEGFSNPAVITVACIMIISQAISRSGIIDFAVRKLASMPKNQTLNVGVLTTVCAILSAFMNDVGALALMMPVAIQLAIRERRSP